MYRRDRATGRCYLLGVIMSAVPAIDPKLRRLIEQAGDLSIPLTELESQRALADLDVEIGRVKDMAMAVQLYVAKGGYNLRLKRPEKALAEYRLALQRLPGPSAYRGIVLSNRSAALMALGRYQEAANVCIEAARIPPDDPCVNLSNLAEALDRLGLRELALDTFAEALSVADLRSPRFCFGLAHQAAEIDLDAEAIELLARFVARREGADIGDRPALDVVREAIHAGLDVSRTPALEAVVTRSLAMADELSRIATVDHVEHSEAAEREALAVYESMGELRGRALAGTLGADERAKA
jgi:tetratricopeptide (TPR) repeat protein